MVVEPQSPGMNKTDYSRVQMVRNMTAGIGIRALFHPRLFNNPAGGGVYQSAAPPPTGETLIGVQAKKTWENYFKFLEVIAANTAAITSSLDATNKLLVELGTKLQ
jgi:hypothetical protein